MKVCIIHDWLTGMRGGERVLEIFLDIFPDADIFTLYHRPGMVSEKIESHTIHTSYLQRLPFMKGNYRNYLPLFPMAIESLVGEITVQLQKRENKESPWGPVSEFFSPLAGVEVGGEGYLNFQ